MRSWKFLVVVCLLLPLASVSALAQASGVSGTIYDKTGAVVPNASIELKDLGTNTILTTKSSDVGQFTFVNVAPGNYKLTVTAQGFRQYVVANLIVDVGRTATVNPALEIGTMSQVVEVQAAAGTELSTTDASMGNVMERKMLENIPTITRDATALLLLQPMASPGFNQNQLAGVSGEGDNTGGQVAGARSDQNTFLVDGGDATDSTAGSGQYAGTNFTATPRAVIPTPVESLEEFRVVTNNQDASFGRASGGAVEMVTKHGTNDWHGAAYEFHTDNALNANSWTRNENGANCLAKGILSTAKCDAIAKNRVLRDNRFGARFGGPIWKDKTFFFVHYEGRRFDQNVDITRLVPSGAMKAGILHFAINGQVQAINLNPVPTVDPGVCNPSGVPLGFTPGTMIAPAMNRAGTGLIDPRGLGLNSITAAVWAFEPEGTNCLRGDGLNSIGFDATAPFKIRENFGVIRLDHKITQNWQATASMRYAVTDAPSTAQMDIGGFLTGDKLGQPTLTSKRPLQPRYLVFGLSGSIGSHITSDFHFDWLRHWWQWGTFHPAPQVPGTTQALTIAGTGQQSAMIPINFDVQNARSRLWNGHDYNFSENLSWIKGSHLVTWGGRAETQRFFHVRDDKVLGNLIYPVDIVGRIGDNALSIPSNDRPVGLASTDSSRYKNFYSTVLGMVDNGGALLTRAADFTPNPPLTPLHQNTVVDSYQLYVADSWKLKPSLTVYYGLTWGVQLPPYEQSGLSTIPIDDTTGKVINSADYLAARKSAALAGTIYNPQFDFVPIKKTGRKYPYDPDYSNFAPRVGAAWNPSFTNGWLGSLFGDRKTVIRAGYGRIYDRLNGVGIVMIPALGIGFGNSVQCHAPLAAGGCLPPTSSATPTTSFRIGTDGPTVPIPGLAPITGNALIPGVNSPFEQLDFRIDPHRKIGYSDGVDFSIQRELPGNLLLEVGYRGTYSKRLYQGVGLDNAAHMLTLGGQTFAQSFSAIRQFMVANPSTATTPGPQVTGFIPTGPLSAWWDTALGGPTSAYCSSNIPAGTPAGAANCATAVANANPDGPTGFVFSNVFDIWDSLTGAFTPAISPGGGVGLDSNQITDAYWIGSTGHSNYNAGFVSLRSRGWKGLTFDVNYTLSHAFDQIGLNQESLNEASDAFNLNRDYGSAQFDRRHVFNGIVTYDLPFGKGKMFSSSSGWVNNIIGGWNVSGVYVYGSGLASPGGSDVFNSFSCEEFGASIYFDNCSAYFPISSPKFVNAHPSNKNTTAFPNVAAVMNNYLQTDPVTGDVLAEGTPDFTQGRTGRGFIRSYGRWNLDLGVSKTTKITERVSARFDMQMTNAFNHPLLFHSSAVGDICLDLSGFLCSPFGKISSQYNAPRFIQFGLKIEF
jgi:hypothetical protein